MMDRRSCGDKQRCPLPPRGLPPALEVLLFGANGAFGAVATPVGIKLSMNLGFAATMRIGAAAYAAVILLVLLIALIDRLGKAAPEPA